MMRLLKLLNQPHASIRDQQATIPDDLVVSFCKQRLNAQAYDSDGTASDSKNEIPRNRAFVIMIDLCRDPSAFCNMYLD